MGLEQNIKFDYNLEELTQLIKSLDYAGNSNVFLKQDSNLKIKIILTKSGILIERSGKYFYELGLLIERLGEITQSITIEDK